jgi:hypothetical protein
MKQLLSLFLFLLPCFALAQYPSNGNQKITLGEQTTADGLIFRGVASIDTVTATSKITRANKQDTSAFILLDTVTNLLWHYKTASNGWSQAGGSTFDTTTLNLVSRFGLKLNISDTSSMLTNYYRSGRALGTPSSGVLTSATGLPISSGLTGLGAANRIPFASSATALTTSSSFTYNNSTTTVTLDGVSGAATLSILGDATAGSIIRMNRSLGSSVLTCIGDIIYYGSGDAANYSIFNGGGVERMRLNTAGELGIGYGATDNGAYKLQVNSQIFATNATIATSDIRYKENIQPLDKGLEIINKLKPVKFNFITTTENNFSEFDEIGFIAQDVEGALSTELFAKAVVKKLDEDKDDSALGLMTEKFIPILVKAIQEQQAIIKALEQRIINLENK